MPVAKIHPACELRGAEGLQPWDEVAPQYADVGRLGDVNETLELLPLNQKGDSKP